MYAQDLVNEAAAAALRSAYAAALAAGLKAAAIAEAERARAAGLPARELTADDRTGSLRLDGAGRPAAPVISDAAATTSWLAEHAPHLVRAALTVPVDRLEEALQVLEMLGMREDTVAARVEFRDPGEAAKWLADNCTIQADPDLPGKWNVLYRQAREDGEEGATLTPVPGVSAVKHHVAAAQVEVDGLVARLRQDDAAGRAAATPDAEAPDLEASGSYVVTEQDRARSLPQSLEEAADDPAGFAAGVAALRARLDAVAAFRARLDATDAETGIYDGDKVGPVDWTHGQRMAAAVAARETYRAQSSRELADQLRARGLSVVGGKDERINRLLESDGHVMIRAGAVD
jgi:hypothetical protein